jgi:hypothetical protein
LAGGRAFRSSDLHLGCECLCSSPNIFVLYVRTAHGRNVDIVFSQIGRLIHGIMYRAVHGIARHLFRLSQPSPRSKAPLDTVNTPLPPLLLTNASVDIHGVVGAYLSTTLSPALLVYSNPHPGRGPQNNIPWRITKWILNRSRSNGRDVSGSVRRRSTAHSTTWSGQKNSKFKIQNSKIK